MLRRIIWGVVLFTGVVFGIQCYAPPAPCLTCPDFDCRVHPGICRPCVCWIADSSHPGICVYFR